MNFFKELSEQTDIPICNIEFLSDVSPPYAVYQVKSENNIYADSKVVYSEKSVDLVLYHEKTDFHSELVTETFLQTKHMSYEKSNVWIEDEKIVETTYELNFNKMEEL